MRVAHVTAALVTIAAVVFTRGGIHAFLASSLHTRHNAFDWVDSQDLNGSYYTFFADLVRGRAEHDIDEYMQLVDEVSERNRGEGVSLKMQQVGAAGTRRICLRAAARSIPCIVSAYKATDVDMEFKTVMETIFEAKRHKLNPSYIGLCVVVDAFDFEAQVARVRAVLDAGGRVRLVKGGWYSGSASGMKAWEQVTHRFVALAAVAVKRGYVEQLVIATHDFAAIDAIKNVSGVKRLPFFMFRSGFVPTTDARVGVFYGQPMPLRQIFSDVSLHNALMRMANLKTFTTDYSTHSMKNAFSEVKRFFEGSRVAN